MFGGPRGAKGADGIGGAPHAARGMKHIGGMDVCSRKALGHAWLVAALLHDPTLCICLML